MKSPLPSPRATFQRLADPADFQPFTVITKGGLHAKVSGPERIHLPPDADAGWVTVYNTPMGNTIFFRDVERIEFDAGTAKKPIPFARWMKSVRWAHLLLGGEAGFVIGMYVGAALEHAAKR